MPRVRIVASVVVLLGWVTPAAGEPDRVRLDDRGSACALDALGTQVAALVGYDPFDDGAPRVLSIATTLDESGATAEVALDEDSTRRVRAVDCDELVRSLAVVVALVLRVPPVDEPDGAVPPVEAPPVEASSPELRYTPRIAASIVIPARPRSSPIEIAVVAGGAGTRSAPRWAPELTIGIRVSRRRALTGVEMTLRAPDDVPVDTGGSVAVSAGRASWLGCYRGPVDLCAVVAGGAIRGRGEARAASTPFAAIGGRIGWERRVSRRLSVELHGEVRGAVTTTRFLVDGMPVWTSPRLEATAGAGVIAHIP